MFKELWQAKRICPKKKSCCLSYKDNYILKSKDKIILLWIKCYASSQALALLNPLLQFQSAEWLLGEKACLEGMEIKWGPQARYPYKKGCHNASRGYLYTMVIVALFTTAELWK